MDGHVAAICAHVARLDRDPSTKIKIRKISQIHDQDRNHNTEPKTAEYLENSVDSS